MEELKRNVDAKKREREEKEAALAEAERLAQAKAQKYDETLKQVETMKML